MSKKISQLTAITASNVQQTSVLPMSQGAETYKIAISDLKTLVSPELGFLNSQITFTAQTSYTVDLLNDDVIFCDDLSSVTIDGVQQGKKLTFVNQSKTGSCQIDASIEGSSFYALGPQEKITIIGETINIGEWIIISKS